MPTNYRLIRLTLAVTTIWIFARAALGEDMHYTAVFTDGNRMTGAHLSEWGVANNQPKLNGRALFDQSNPIRWLKKETPEQSNPPTAFVELFGGDCLPGRVVASGNTTTLEEGELPAHLI